MTETIKNDKPTKQSRKDRKEQERSTIPTHDKYDDIQVTENEHKRLMMLSMGGLLFALISAGVILYMFFATDTISNIGNSMKPDPVVVVPPDNSDDNNNDNNGNPNDSDDSDNNGDGQDGSNDESDDDSTSNDNDSEDNSDKDSVKSEESTDEDILKIMPEGIKSNEDVISYLDELDGSEFNDFVKEFAEIKGLDESDINSGNVKTLEEAYADAEAEYPGQINGSKRLTLIENINAVDYKYYVVEKGDTISALNTAFDVSIGQIVETNGIKDANFIEQGSVLLFPIDTEQPGIK